VFDAKIGMMRSGVDANVTVRPSASRTTSGWASAADPMPSRPAKTAASRIRT
jgi:hypothetical protein